jgi:replicative DNA helicase
MFLSKDAIDIAIELLHHSYFYRPAHRKIFKAIIGLYERNEPADLITVSDELANRGQLDEIGGRAYLTGLIDATPGISNIEHHARIVLEKATRGMLIDTANEIIYKANENGNNLDELLDAAENSIFSIKDKKLRQVCSPVKDLLPEVYDEIETHARTGEISGLRSGFSDLDDITSGFQDSDLVVIASRPSVGKTAFSLNIAELLAVKDNIPVMIFSMEMSSKQLVQRMLCTRARVPSHRVRSGRLSDEQWTTISMAVGPLSEAPIFIDDTPTMTVLEMRAKARRIKSREDIRLIIVDYMQLIQGPKGAENRQQEITFISRSLKAMARELAIPVIALSQLSRQVELRGKEARPQLSDLRESGAIEQDADMVIFIHRPRDSQGHLGKEAEIIIGKQRNGPTGVINLIFVKEYARFGLLEEYREYPESFVK